jgi:hypothetical protein
MSNGAKKAAVTVASLLDELEQARQGASDDRQFAAATSAVIAKAKLSGLMVDKVAIGSASEFSNCSSVADVVRVLLSDQTPRQVIELLDVMRNAIENYAGDHAIVIPAEKPQRQDETLEALKMLRPSKR